MKPGVAGEREHGDAGGRFHPPPGVLERSVRRPREARWGTAVTTNAQPYNPSFTSEKGLRLGLHDGIEPPGVGRRSDGPTGAVAPRS